MKGRKPKLTLVEGGRVEGDCPAAPAWLPDRAKTEWRRAAPELHARGVLTPGSMATLESYCLFVAQVAETEADMAAGRYIKTDKGMVLHPAFRLQQAAAREARLLAAELQLTPHRAASESAGKDAKPDGWDTDLLS